MGSTKKSKKIKASKKGENTKAIKLGDLSSLEGTQEDLELIQDIGEEDEAEEYESESEGSVTNNDQHVADFIQNLGLDKYRPAPNSQKKKKVGHKVKDETDDGIENIDGGIKDPKAKNLSKKKKKNKYKVQDDEITSTTSPQKSTFDTSVDYLPNYKPRQYILIKAVGKWYEAEFSSDVGNFQPASAANEAKLKSFAEILLQDEIRVYNQQQDLKKRSDSQWLKTVMKSGTLSDQMAALTVTIQNSPVHNMTALDTLVAMAAKKGRREAMLAVDSLRELFIKELLPERKLKAFNQHPLMDLETISSGNRESRDKRLIMWLYESQLKDKYLAFRQALELMSHDNLLVTKKSAINSACTLLMEKPEGEKMLLNTIINKLGDPDSKVASEAAFQLSKILTRHPNMKNIVVQEVEKLLYRANISAKAQYFGICFLNQILLSHKESALASRLVMLYFTFFKVVIKKKDVDSKMMGALLTGVNRAYPFAKIERSILEEQTNTLHKVLHTVQFNTAIQALMLLYQVMDSSSSVSDRYYMALYRKMLDPELTTSSKQTMFLNLLFKSIKTDISDRRVQAFIKRLLQICSQQNPTFICGSLVLLSEVIKVKPNILRLSQAVTNLDNDSDEEEHFEDVSDEDNEEDKHEKHKKTSKSVRATWSHKENMNRSGQEYDPAHRNPVYCRAEMSCVWELSKLQNHYHPSVALFASRILKGEAINYPGDPLRDFILIRFLDRFVFKNPKGKRSENEQVNRVTAGQRSKLYRPSGAKSLAVNSEAFLSMDTANVPVDELFFYRYYKKEAERKTKLEDDASDVSVDDDEFDDYLDSHEAGLMSESKNELNFAREMAKELSLKKGKKKRGREAESDDDGEDDIMNLSDEEVDFSDDDAFSAQLKDLDMDEDEGLLEGETNDDWTDGAEESDTEGSFNEEDIAFSDDDDLVDLGKPKIGKKRQIQGIQSDKNFKKQRREVDPTTFLAAAEEFAHLIENDEGSTLDTTGSHSYVNKDKSDIKQLKWEMKRERQMGTKHRRKPKHGAPYKKNKQKGKKKGRK